MVVMRMVVAVVMFVPVAMIVGVVMAVVIIRVAGTDSLHMMVMALLR